MVLGRVAVGAGKRLDALPQQGVALFEFGGPSLTVIMAKSEDDYIVMTLGELLPYGFGPANLD